MYESKALMISQAQLGVAVEVGEEGKVEPKVCARRECL